MSKDWLIQNSEHAVEIAKKQSTDKPLEYIGEKIQTAIGEIYSPNEDKQRLRKTVEEYTNLLSKIDTITKQNISIDSDIIKNLKQIGNQIEDICNNKYISETITNINSYLNSLMNKNSI